ncbi:MAG: hypothetical protein ACM3O9_05625 [Methylocystaceae bacterium]
MSLGGGIMQAFMFGWQLFNLLVMLLLIAGLVLVVVSLWKQARAQEKMAVAFLEIANKFTYQSTDKVD